MRPDSFEVGLVPKTGVDVGEKAACSKISNSPSMVKYDQFEPRTKPIEHCLFLCIRRNFNFRWLARTSRKFFQDYSVASWWHSSRSLMSEHWGSEEGSYSALQTGPSYVSIGLRKKLLC